jgi:hypothetical protein
MIANAMVMTVIMPSDGAGEGEEEVTKVMLLTMMTMLVRSADPRVFGALPLCEHQFTADYA